MNPVDLTYKEIIFRKWDAKSFLRAILPLFQIAGIKISDHAIEFMAHSDKYITNEDSDIEAQKGIIFQIESNAHFITEFSDLNNSYVYFRERHIYKYYFLLIPIVILKAAGWALYDYNNDDIEKHADKFDIDIVDIMSTSEKQEEFVDDMLRAVNAF
jgi:hypothetical protein